VHERRPRVVDFSTHLSGPLAAHLLSEMGADVVKIEAPGLGDRTRGLRPQINGRGMLHVALNSGARSLAVSTRSPHWPQIVQAAAEWADAVIVGSRPIDAARRGLDFSSLSRHNHTLTYCSISGYGEVGPWRDYVAHGQNIDAMAGNLGVTWSDGIPETPPGWRSSGTSLAGVFGAMAVLAGISRANSEGRAQHVSVSQWASALWWNWRDLTCLTNLGEPWRDYQELGTRYAMYPTSDDRAILIAPTEEKFWRRFCEIAVLPDDWPDFGSWSDSGLDFGRGPNYEHERAVLVSKMQSRPLREWWNLLEKAGIPFAPVLTMSEALESDHATAEQILSSTTVLGSPARVVNSPIRFHEEVRGEASPPPEIGADTPSVLSDFGLPSNLASRLEENQTHG
jgi:crotonobetainyl-CoA:carnitine CoA-transferase CaiB-like acyl-CoA transferase